MNSQLTKKAVQLIAFDQNKNPYITEEALKVLSNLSTNNIHVIAVAGKYRTGKSYILNRVLLDRSSGFNVGHTINACTKGLWMWPELIRLGQKDCLIIDTEGLGSLQQGQSTDLKIFMLALLFSSYLIYNSTGNIDEQALQSLNLVIQLANVLQRQDRYDTQELVNTFPSFLWLLRDFSLKLVTDKGEDITPTEYLEQALKHQPKTTPAAERKNQIRKQLRTFFEHRDCFSLVRPTEQERDLQNLSTLPANRLRPEFVKLISQLKTHISQQVRPKRVRGRVLSMDGFVELCKYYTKALVDGKLPTITSHWDHLCLGQTHRIFQKYQLEHIKALQQAQSEHSNFQKVHSSIVKAGLQAIEKSFLGKLQKQLFKQRFERKLQNQFNQLKIKINNKKNTEMKLLLDSLEGIQDSDITILEQYEKMMEKMSQLSEKSTKDDGLYCELFLYLSQHSRSLLEQSESRRFEAHKSLNQKIAFLQDNLASLKVSRDKLIQGHNSEIALLRKQNASSCSVNYEQIKQKQKKSLEEIHHLKAENKHLKNQNKRLVSELEKMSLQLSELEVNKKEKDKQLVVLQEKYEALEIQQVKKEEIIKQDHIKFRKLFREKQVIKNRYEEFLDQNVALRNRIDELQHHITLKQTESSKDEADQLLRQTKLLLRQSEEENRFLQNLMNDQKLTFQTIFMAPQNQHYLSLKQNLDLEIKQKQALQLKFYEASLALSNCQCYQCKTCKREIAGQLILPHLRCCKEEQQQLTFDVSYTFEEGQMLFVIQIRRGEKTWKINKSQREVKIFLYHLGDQGGQIFEIQEQDDSVDLQNMFQQRRKYLDQLLHSLKNQSDANPAFRQFLEMDSDSIVGQDSKEWSANAMNSSNMVPVNDVRGSIQNVCSNSLEQTLVSIRS